MFKSHKIESLGLEAIFQSISSSNNREVDIEIYTPKADYYEIPIYLT